MAADEDKDVPAENVAGGAVIHPLAAAALIGVAAGGAYLGARALAQRNAKGGRKLNSVLATAITASDCKSGDDQR